jgi:actin-related protein 8
MRFYKLRVTPNAAGIASTFNEQFKPEIIEEDNDPFRVDWINEPLDEFVVGENVSPAFLLSDLVFDLFCSVDS